jgi:adenosylcobyric acid synthase
MVCGTASNAGKTTIVAGLCRLLARRGLRVAPFKAQNMALNSAVTASGHEIGRAQFAQAQAAGVPATVDMNPVLLKPTTDREAQVIVAGRPIGAMSAAEYHEYKPELFELVLASLQRLRDSFDVVVAEGAGSPAEINLAADDIVNLRIAERAGLGALLVGDIDLGGVFAALAGTVALLPAAQRELVRGFLINRFRGDPALLGDGLDELERRCGVPTLGVIPMLDDLHLPDEDSVALAENWRPHDAVQLEVTGPLDVAVISFPRLSNFTDFDPLVTEPDVALRLVRSVRELGRPDLILLGGSKATVADLLWMRERGLAAAVLEAATEHGAVVLGICGGYQMLGSSIADEVESSAGTVAGLGLLGVETVFEHDKVLAQRHGQALGARVEGYQIHHGRVRPSFEGATEPWLWLGDEPDGFRDGSIMGTSLHGVFDSDAFRHAFLAHVAEVRGCDFVPAPGPFVEHRDQQFDRVADALEAHVDLGALFEIMEIAA